jgi:hydroxyacylglutathione hydrolase
MVKRFFVFPVLMILIAFSLSIYPAQKMPESSAAGKEYVSTKLAPGIWHIEDTVQKTARNSMYLVEGTEKAALIDTGMGSGNLAGYVRTLTNLPVIALITHGHGDHTGQASQFATVYFPQKAATFNQPFDRSKALALAGGQKIGLGGKDLEVIEIPGHTPGSVAFLRAKDHMIFTGDAIGSSFVWNHIGGTCPLIEYLGAVRKLETRMGEFDSSLH